LKAHTEAVFLEKQVIDALAEFVNLGMGKAGEVLNQMLNSHIALSAPTIRFIDQRDLSPVLAESPDSVLSAVEMVYRGSMEGAVELVFKTADAGKLVDCIIGQENIQEEGLDSIRSGTLCEVGNIVINAVLGTISNELRLDLEYTVPAYQEKTAQELVEKENLRKGQIILLIETQFLIESLEINGNIIIFLSIRSYEKLKQAVIAYLGLVP
jgi:chemotaxis protein CheC